MALKEHYLMEDWPQVLDNIEVIGNSSMALKGMATNAEFSSKQEHLAKINQAVETIMALNRKKIDRELNSQATAMLKDWF